MGYKSTKYITRRDALTEILLNLAAASDSELANVLEELIGEKYRSNFVIVDEYNPANDKTWNWNKEGWDS